MKGSPKNTFVSTGSGVTSGSSPVLFEHASTLTLAASIANKIVLIYIYLFVLNTKFFHQRVVLRFRNRNHTAVAYGFRQAVLVPIGMESIPGCLEPRPFQFVGNRQAI